MDASGFLEQLKDFINTKMGLGGLEQSIISNFQASTAISRRNESIGVLLKLINLRKPNSDLEWGLISILERACASVSLDRHLLDLLLLFVQELVNTLNSSRTVEKKRRILKILKTITCVKNGIPDQTLRATVKILVEMILNEHEVAQMALFVLVNIVNKNESAAFFLLIHPDFKYLMTHLSVKKMDELDNLEALKVALLMRPALGSVSNSSEDEVFVHSTFLAVQNHRGEILLRTVDFFFDVVNKHRINLEISGADLSELVVEFLNFLKKVALEETIERTDASAFFIFIQALVKMNQKNLYHFYPEMLTVVLSMIAQKSWRCSQALELFCILTNQENSSNISGSAVEEICAQVAPSLLECCTSVELQKYESHQAYVSYQLSLLHFLCQASCIPTVRRFLDQELTKRDLVFSFLEFLTSTSSLPNSESEMCVILFLDLLSGLAPCIASYQKLLLNKKVILRLANSFKSSDWSLIHRSFSLITSKVFPEESLASLAKYMAEEYPPYNQTSSSILNGKFEFKVKDVLSNKTAQLYEEKSQSFIQTQNMLQMKQVDDHLAMQVLKNELDVSNELICSLESDLASVHTTVNELRDTLLHSEEQIQTQEKKAEEQITALEKEIMEQRKAVESLEEDFQCKTEKVKALMLEKEDLNTIVTEKNLELAIKMKELSSVKEKVLSLERQLKKMESCSEEKETELAKLNIMFNELNIEKKELENSNLKICAKIQEVEDINNKTQKELEDLRRVQEAICQLTGGKQRF